MMGVEWARVSPSCYPQHLARSSLMPSAPYFYQLLTLSVAYQFSVFNYESERLLPWVVIACTMVAVLWIASKVHICRGELKKTDLSAGEIYEDCSYHP